MSYPEKLSVVVPNSGIVQETPGSGGALAQLGSKSWTVNTVPERNPLFKVDAGPILAQKAFPLRRDDTVDEIKRRGQEAEAEVLVEALEVCLKEDLDVHWGRVW